MDFRAADDQLLNQPSRPSVYEGMPSFDSIAKKIQEEFDAQEKEYLPYLAKYDLCRKNFEEQGYSYTTTCLMQAFVSEMEAAFPPLRNLALLKVVSLFSTMLLFTEFELVVWTCFCKPDKVAEVVEGCSAQTTGMKQVLSHLINTAYYTKSVCLSDEDFLMIQAFFDQNFQIFQGRHTDWLLLQEPDLTEISPAVISARFDQLSDTFRSKLQMTESRLDDTQVRDFNEMTRLIMEEADLIKQKTHQRYMPKQTKKKRETKTLAKEKEKLKRLCGVEERVPEQPEVDSAEFKVVPQQSFNQPSQFFSQLFASVSPQKAAQTRPSAGAVIRQPSVNLNNSIVWQTQQSAIFDMNMIMRTIVEGDQAPTIKQGTDVGQHPYDQMQTVAAPPQSSAQPVQPEMGGYPQAPYQTAANRSLINIMNQAGNTSQLFQHQFNSQFQPSILNFNTSRFLHTIGQNVATHQQSFNNQNVAEFLRSYSLMRQQNYGVDPHPTEEQQQVQPPILRSPMGGQPASAQATGLPVVDEANQQGYKHPTFLRPRQN